MSFLAGARQARPSSSAPDEVDLDLTPIMNLFIILVPSLVSIAVFVHVAVIRADLPPNAAGAAGPGKADLKVTLTILPSAFTLSVGEILLDSLPKTGGIYDFKALASSLARERDKAKNRDDLVVAVEDGVIFDDVVAAMDAGRSAGFSKLGLAGGAGGK